MPQFKLPMDSSITRGVSSQISTSPDGESGGGSNPNPLRASPDGFSKANVSPSVGGGGRQGMGMSRPMMGGSTRLKKGSMKAEAMSNSNLACKADFKSGKYASEE